MKFIIAAAFALVGSATAFAQTVAPQPQQQVPFVAITIDETTYNGLVQYLSSVPYGYAVPLVNGFARMEADAAAAAAAAAAKSRVMPAAPTSSR